MVTNVLKKPYVILKKEAAGYSEMFIRLYQTTWCHIPEQTIFWDMTPCSLIETYSRPLRKAIYFTVMYVSVYQITRRHSPAYNNLQRRRYENLKSEFYLLHQVHVYASNYLTWRICSANSTLLGCTVGMILQEPTIRR
jgi:hypothetical protein